MKTFFARLARLSRRAKILLAVAGVVLIIAVVGGALLAFDRPLLARLARSLPGKVIDGPEQWVPDGFEFCANQGLWNTCPASSWCQANGDVIYGVEGQTFTKPNVKDGICCNDASIGYDPAVGQEKKCFRRKQ